jgi:hypothetical protein
MGTEVTPLTRDQLALFNGNMVLAAYIARSYRVKAREHRVPLEDVTQEAYLALVNAVRTWDPDRNPRIVFATHAGLWVRSVIGKMLRKAPPPLLSEFATIADRRPHTPKLEPLFPVTTYEPLSRCPHRGLIEEDSPFVCMVCHQSGIEGHPGLQRNARTDPQPEPAPPKPHRAPLKLKVETRHQRRARIYGTPAA